VHGLPRRLIPLLRSGSTAPPHGPASHLSRPRTFSISPAAPCLQPDISGSPEQQPRRKQSTCRRSRTRRTTASTTAATTAIRRPGAIAAGSSTGRIQAGGGIGGAGKQTTHSAESVCVCFMHLLRGQSRNRSGLVDVAGENGVNDLRFCLVVLLLTLSWPRASSRARGPLPRISTW
jgi:hypothetical protein